MKQFVILGIILFFVVAGFHPVNIWGDSASLQEKIKAEKERRLKFYKSLSEYDRALLGVNIVGDNLEKPSNNGTLLYGEDGGIPREVLEESGINYGESKSNGIPREVLEESGFPRYKKPEKSYDYSEVEKSRSRKKSSGIPQDILNESGFPSYRKADEDYSYKKSDGIPLDVLEETFGRDEDKIVVEQISPSEAVSYEEERYIDKERKKEEARKAKLLLVRKLKKEAQKRILVKKKTDSLQDKNPEMLKGLKKK